MIMIIPAERVKILSAQVEEASFRIGWLDCQQATQIKSSIRLCGAVEDDDYHRLDRGRNRRDIF